MITNHGLEARAGTELVVRDLGVALRRRGHEVTAYSPRLGAVADELRAHDVAVVDRLDGVAAPDIIHGHHFLETTAAAVRFPHVPVVSICHGARPWQETPVTGPRVAGWGAVDAACRERVLAAGAAPERVAMLPNFVDLERFQPRPPLPLRPTRALIFSNRAGHDGWAAAVRTACEAVGMTVDTIGATVVPTATPEAILGAYDLVFAKGRAALEALAVGAAVVLCDVLGLGPMVSAAQVPALRAQNFGFRTFTEPVTAAGVAARLAQYNAADAARASAQIRTLAGLDAAVDALLAVYAEAQTFWAANAPSTAHVADGMVADLARFAASVQVDVLRFLDERTAAERTTAGMRAELSSALERAAQWERTAAERLANLQELTTHYQAAVAERDAVRRELTVLAAARGVKGER